METDRDLSSQQFQVLQDAVRALPEMAGIYQWPTLGIDAQGSFGGSASPFCSSSIEMLSGERTNAMWPSRGGLLIVPPASMSYWHSA